MAKDASWLTVYGFGAHIKSTQKKLVILKKGAIEEHPLENVKNLLVVGGHTLNSATIIHLLKNGAYISFFEADGTPVGIIRPYGDCSHEQLQKMQFDLPRHRYATIIAQAAIKSRLLAIERLSELRGVRLFYEGESQFLHTSLDELAYLIKLDEIRRLSRLNTDMYYEIISRNIPEQFGYRRRTMRPQCDPVNAMLSFGYAMLFGNCCVAIIGARLDPDIGLLHEGTAGLVYDLIETFKAEMIDTPVCRIANEVLGPEDFELTPNRCILSDDLVKRLTEIFQVTIDNDKINSQVDNFYRAMTENEEFTIMY
jgi:CRISPR-associated endonuclease Cas1